MSHRVRESVDRALRNRIWLRLSWVELVGTEQASDSLPSQALEIKDGSRDSCLAQTLHSTISRDWNLSKADKDELSTNHSLISSFHTTQAHRQTQRKLMLAWTPTHSQSMWYDPHHIYSSTQNPIKALDYIRYPLITSQTFGFSSLS